MSRAQSVPIVVVCPTCSATYNIIVQMAKTAGHEHWRYELPEHCTHCGEPMQTIEIHTDVRATAKEFL